VYGSGGRGTNAVKVRGKSSTNGSVSEVLLHHTELALGTAFSSIKFNLLALYHLKFVLVCPISVDISDNTRIPEIYDGVVDEELRGGGGVKDVEVVVFDPRVVEIGSGMCLCVEGNGILGITLLMNTYDVSIHADLSEGDITCHLILTILVEKDKWVLPCITVVIFAPPISWMIWVIELLSELRDIGDRTRCGGKGNSGVVLSEPNQFIALHIAIRHITLNFVKNLGNEEMLYGSIVPKGSGEYFFFFFFFFESALSL